MPNWCYTEYRMYGSRSQRDTLCAALNVLKGLPKPKVENGFGNLWLGCLIDILGGNWEDVPCRGQVLDYDNYEDYLSLATETAWAECNEFRHFLAEKFPDLSIYHRSEEFGLSGIWTNDMEGEVFDTNYYLDCCDVGDMEPDYFYKIEEVADYINDNIKDANVKPDLKEIQEFLDNYSEEHEDEWIHLYEIERVDD